MSFQSIYGQDLAVDFLTRSLASGRLHHAYLLTGPDGVGKSKTARAFAAALLCPSAQVAGAESEECTCVQRVNGGQHADVHVLERLEKKDGNRERFIKIAQVRALQGELKYKAFEGLRRVILILEAEAMTPATANALLKTLEEPGHETYFVLVTNAPHRLLPTVVSRCQRVRFSPLPSDFIREKVRAEFGLSSTDAEVVSALSEGSLGRAQALMEADILELRQGLIELILAPGSTPSVASVMSHAEALAKPVNRDNLPMVFQLLRTWYRDLLLLHSGAGVDQLVNADCADSLAIGYQRTSREKALAILSKVADAEVSIFERSANARLVMESLLVSMTMNSLSGSPRMTSEAR